MRTKQVAMPDGTIRRFNYRDPMTIQVVRPDHKNGTPVWFGDLIVVPVKRSGEWNLGDMLNQSSIGALFTAYNRAEEAIAARTAVKRAPARKVQAHRA